MSTSRKITVGDTIRWSSPGWQERFAAMTQSVELPLLRVDLATHRRLVAMAQRIHGEDETLDPVGDFEHVVYAAICEGLRGSELEAGVVYNESTGRLIGPVRRKRWWRR